MGDPYLLKNKFLQISGCLQRICAGAPTHMRCICGAYALELQRICAGAATHMRWSQRICVGANAYALEPTHMRCSSSAYAAHMRCICARTAAHMPWGQKTNEASDSLSGKNVFSNHTQCIWYFFTFSRMRCRPLRKTFNCLEMLQTFRTMFLIVI